MKIKHAQYYLATIEDKKYSPAQKDEKLYKFFKGEKSFKKASLKQIRQHTALLTQIFNDGEVPEFKRVIKIGKVKYGLEPSIDDMEAGAFLDLDALVHGDISGSLHKIMATLYRPITLKIGNRYEVKSYVDESMMDFDNRARLFLDEFEYKHAVGVVNFFWSIT